MKLTVLSRALAFGLLLGSATLIGSQPIQAQDLPSLVQSPNEIRAFKTLNNRLYACILAIQPRATIHTNDGYSFSGRYNDEFSLTVTIEQDTMHYRTPVVPQSLQGEQKERFETSYTMRHNLESVDPKARVESPDIPLGNINYQYLGQLSNADLIELPTGTYSRSYGMTRYEFAVVTKHLTKQFQQASKSPESKGISIADAYAHVRAHYGPQVADAYLALAAEFSEDWKRFEVKIDPTDVDKPLVEGQPWRPRYKYLQVEFKYGKEFDDRVVTEIKRAVAEYAAQFQT